MSELQPTFDELFPDGVPTWSATTNFLLPGTPVGWFNIAIIEHDGWILADDEINGDGNLSGTIPPDLTGMGIGDSVGDGDYVWIIIKSAASWPPTPTTWATSTVYDYADMVWPTTPDGSLWITDPEFPFGGAPSTTEPIWSDVTTLGGYVDDPGSGQYWVLLGFFESNSFTADAILKKTQLPVATADAVIAARGFTADAVIKGNQVFGAPADAVIATDFGALPTFVGAGTSADGTGAVTPGLPAGLLDGDILLLHIESEGEDANPEAAPTGSDWHFVGTAASGIGGAAADTRHTLYWILYEGITPDLTVPDSGDHTLAIVTAWRGCDPSDPILGPNIITGATPTTAHIANGGLGIISLPGECVVVLTLSHGDDNGGASALNNDFSCAGLSNFTRPVSVGTSQGSDGTLGVAYGGRMEAGTFLNAITWSSTVSVERAGLVIALVPLTQVEPITPQEIVITYDGDPITDDVLFASARFVSRAYGLAGDGYFRVKDLRDGPYAPGFFQIGKRVTVDVDDVRVWSGYVMGVAREYAFSVEDTTDPIIPRFWGIHLADMNILFQKRVVYNTVTPEHMIPVVAAGTSDQSVVEDITDIYSDISEDGLTEDIDHTMSLEASHIIANPGETLAQAMSLLSATTRAIFFIDPYDVFRYHDVNDVTAMRALSDRPTAGVLGGREMSVLSDATAMANDAFVWGAGVGSDQMVFTRVQDTASISEHGRFQWADFRSDMFLQESVDHRADSYIYGSPQTHRGHKDDRTVWRATVFRPGYYAGQVVDIRLGTFGMQEDVPIREMQITFPTTQHAKFDMELSHDIDPPWAAPDWPFFAPPTFPPEPGMWTDTFTIPPQGPAFIGEGNDTRPFDEEGPDTTWNEYTIWKGDDFALELLGPRTPLEALTHVTTVGYWVYNIVVHTQTNCGVGPGGWGPQRRWQSEWFPVMYDLDPDANPNSQESALGRSLFVPFRTVRTRGTCGTLRAYLTTAPPVVSANRGAQGDLIGTWDITGDIVGDPAPWVGASPSAFYGRYEEIAGFTIPYSTLAQGTLRDNGLTCVWIGFVPDWEVQAGFACDIFYSNPAHPTALVGPVATGEWGSGSIEATMEGSTVWIGTPSLPPADPTLTTTANPYPGQRQTPVAASFDARWETSFAYVPGSLEVLLEGIPLRRNVEFWEIDPDEGTFKISVPYDATTTGNITVRYQLQHAIPSPYEPRSYATDPSDLPNGVVGGRIYRPRFVSQLGWGSALDGVNCVAAAGCVLLDRQTLGQKTATPPEMRSATGDSSGGLTQEQLRDAISSSYGETTFLPGTISWEQFLTYMRSGRGCLLSGNSANLVPWDLHARSEYTGQPFLGPHSVFINEERGDGYFYVYDPAFRPGSKYGISPGWYPPAAIRAYASGRTGSTNLVYGLFTRKTPLV